MKNLLRFPLNIQLFNDGGTEVDVKTSPEYLKLKSQFDSLASQVADYKKKEKASLPELDQLRKDLEEQKKATADAQKEIDTLPMPVYALSKQEDFALSLNFDRLAVMRPDYGYFCHKNLEMPMNDADGIWHVDVATKEVKLIITLQQLIDLKPVETMEGARHKVNHIDISPDGKRFMFLHRWVGPKGRYMRLITANADGSDMYILNGDKMTSHSYWVDNNRIVSFCHTPETGDAYVMFEDKTDNRKLLSKKLPVTDGHPSTINQGEWMVTDSYPGHDAMSRLYLYNIKTDKLICLGRFYQPLKYKGPGRIDLHPKWNMQGTHVYFESGHDGKRRLYSINVESLLK